MKQRPASWPRPRSHDVIGRSRRGGRPTWAAANPERLRGRACHPQQMRSDGQWIWLPGWPLPFDVLGYDVTRVPDEAQR
jgi:hypothetical protein